MDSLNLNRSGGLHLCVCIQIERVSVANERAQMKLGLLYLRVVILEFRGIISDTKFILNISAETYARMHSNTSQ